MSEVIKACVIGHPINHSKSPLIHNYWIEAYKLNGSYEAVDISRENLKSDVQRLINDGYKGFNVTVPHKESIMELCDDVAHNAQNIGAVNTVVVKDGKLHGLNTDGYGFVQNILDAKPDFNFEGKRAVVLGAGGAARAVVSALIGEQIEQIVIVNRTREKAQKIIDEMAFLSDLIIAGDWDDRSALLEGADLLINTTSLGMEGQVPLDIDLSALPKTALVNDIVYAPLHTPLLKSAEQKGLCAVTGIGMLLHQARPAFKEWFDILPDVTEALRQKAMA